MWALQQNGGRPCSFTGEGTQRLKSFSRCEFFPISSSPHSVSVACGSRLSAHDEIDGSGKLVYSSLPLKPTLTLSLLLPLLTSWFLTLHSLERGGHSEETRMRTGSPSPHTALGGFLRPATPPTALADVPGHSVLHAHCPELTFFQANMTHPLPSLQTPSPEKNTDSEDRVCSGALARSSRRAGCSGAGSRSGDMQGGPESLCGESPVCNGLWRVGRVRAAGRKLGDTSGKTPAGPLPLEGPAEGAALMDTEGSHLYRTWDGHHRPDHGGL